MNCFKIAFQRLQHHKLRVRKEKCQFLSPSVEFLRYRIDVEGRHPLKAKVEAIQNAPVSRHEAELRSFLLLLNYYESYIVNLALLFHPLNQLLCKNTK